MNDSEYNKDKLIEHLYAVMNKETEKSYEEMDADLVEACTELILELQGKNFTLSNEELEEKVRKIQFTDDAEITNISDINAPSKTRRKKSKPKKLLLIAAMGSLLGTLLMVFAAGNRYRTTESDIDSIINILKQTYGSVANAPKNESIYFDDNIEVIVSDSGKIYNSREEFFENEDYDVLIPAQLPDDINIVDIYFSNSQNIVVTFDSVVTCYVIEIDTDIPQAVYKKTNETVTTENNIVYYFEYLKETDTFQVHFSYNGDYYWICGTDEQILLNIINNLEEYK